MANPVQEWRELAACRGADPRLFDPLDETELGEHGPHPAAHPRIRQAINVCARCPVRLACDLWASASRQQGVWGRRYRTQAEADGSEATRRARPRRKAAA